MTRVYVPRSTSPARRHRISVWTTFAEKSMVEDAAALAGMSVAAYIRDIVLTASHATIKEKS